MSESDNRFDAILKASAKKLLEEDIEIANSIDTTNTVVSKKAFRKVRRKIKTQYKDSWWNTVPVACRRTVAAILCVCTFAFCLCMTVAPIRAEFIKIFVNGDENISAFIDECFINDNLLQSCIARFVDEKFWPIDIINETNEKLKIYISDSSEKS